MASHMVAVPYCGELVGARAGDRHDAITTAVAAAATSSAAPARQHWLNQWAVASVAESGYNWMDESAWAHQAGMEAAMQNNNGLVSWLFGGAGAGAGGQKERAESSEVEVLHLSCTTPTPTPSTPGTAKSACSSIKAPWVRTQVTHRCDTPRGAYAPKTVRSGVTSNTTSRSSADLLTTSPSLVLPPRPRGLDGLAKSRRHRCSSQTPCEPVTAPPPTTPSPSFLVLELEQNVSVTNTKIESGVGLYEITWSDKNDAVHTVWRRYSDFSALHMSLCDDHLIGETVESITFPPKRPLSSFSRAQREKLLGERRDDLENYLARLVLEGIVTPGKNDAAGKRLAAFLTAEPSPSSASDASSPGGELAETAMAA